MGTNSRYGADLSGRVDPNPVALDTQLPPLSSTESLLGSHIALRSIANIGNTAGLLLSGLVPPTWTRYVDLTALSGASFLKHDRFELKYSGSAVFVPSSLPGAPTEGEFVYTTAGHQFQFWNGTAWVGLSSGSTGVSSVTGTTDQITVTPITGNVIVSLPNQIAVTGASAANILRFSREIAANILLPSKTPAVQIVGGDGTGAGSILNNPPNVALIAPNVSTSVDQNQSNAKLELVATRSTIAQLNAGTFTAITTGDQLGEIRFGGDDAVNIRSHGARIRAAASALWSSGSHPADLYLATVPVGSIGNAVDRWVVQSTGHMVAAVNNSFDIGLSGGNQPRDLYLARNAAIAGLATVGGEKNAQVKWSTSPPSGTPPDGTIWVQY